jgi:hypothetical protein
MMAVGINTGGILEREGTKNKLENKDKSQVRA